MPHDGAAVENAERGDDDAEEGRWKLTGLSDLKTLLFAVNSISSGVWKWLKMFRKTYVKVVTGRWKMPEEDAFRVRAPIHMRSNTEVRWLLPRRVSASLSMNLNEQWRRRAEPPQLNHDQDWMAVGASWPFEKLIVIEVQSLMLIHQYLEKQM